MIGGSREYGDVNMEENTVYTSNYGLLKTVINEEQRDMRMKCKLKFIFYASISQIFLPMFPLM